MKSADRNAKNAYVLSHYASTRSVEELRAISTKYNAANLTPEALMRLNQKNKL